MSVCNIVFTAEQENNEHGQCAEEEAGSCNDSCYCVISITDCLVNFVPDKHGKEAVHGKCRPRISTHQFLGGVLKDEA